MITKQRSKAAFYRRAARTESIEICKSSANLLANMAQMDECMTAICDELTKFIGEDSAERATAAYATAFDTIKKEVSELLMFRMFDSKENENI